MQHRLKPFMYLHFTRLVSCFPAKGPPSTAWGHRGHHANRLRRLSSSPLLQVRRPAMSHGQHATTILHPPLSFPQPARSYWFRHFYSHRTFLFIYLRNFQDGSGGPFGQRESHGGHLATGKLSLYGAYSNSWHSITKDMQNS